MATCVNNVADWMLENTWSTQYQEDKVEPNLKD